MEYTYNVYDDIYHLMLVGSKDIEVRLLNEKSEKILVGDFITFNNLDEKGKYIKTKVIRKTVYKYVEELLLDNDIERILPGSSKEDLVKILVKIFKEGFDNSKLVAFKFKYMMIIYNIYSKWDKFWLNFFDIRKDNLNVFFL